jgi:Ran GTPase-activating protein (RanGAP) involved in mRNA processing and transport
MPPKKQGRGGGGHGSSSRGGGREGGRGGSSKQGAKGSGDDLPGVAQADTIRRLQAQVDHLRAAVDHMRAAVAERDKTIAELRGCGGAKAGAGALCARSGDGPASTPWALVAADVFLSHWCDAGLAPYVELLRLALVCQSMHKKALECLRLLRRLEFRKDLLWPLSEAERLEVVLRAVGQMGGRLESLDLSALGKLSDTQTRRLVQGLAPLKDGQLQELILPCIKPFKAVTKLLSTLSSLQRLDLSKNMLGDEGAIELAKCLGDLVGLRRLNLGGKNNIGGDGCRVLAAKFARIPSLEELLLPNNHMGETGGDFLSRSLHAMTALQVLDLTSNAGVGSQGLGEALGTLSSLHTLRLANTSLVGERLNALLLRGFMAKVPATGGQLLRLSIQRNGFHTEGCAALAKVLPCLPQLQELDVSDNDISPEGMKVLTPALMHMPLRDLKVAENDLGPEGARLLANVLSSLPELSYLDLTDNVIRQGIADLVSADLPPTLTHLSLACNEIDDKGLQAIGAVLHKLPVLKHLQLEENEISDEGIAKFAEHLTDAQALVCLNLIRNRIGDLGCRDLLKPVSQMPSFQKLLLGENEIGEVGYEPMILIATFIHQHIHHLLTHAHKRVEYLDIRSQPPVDTRTHAHMHRWDAWQ